MIWIFLAIHVIVTLITSVVIILFGVRPTRSLSWLLIVFILPFLGVILYILFGINRRKFKFYELKETSKRKLYEQIDANEETTNNKLTFKSINKQRLATLIEKTTHFPVKEGNSLQLLENSKNAYQVIFDNLKKAEKYIHLQYYIFEDGEILNTLCNILETKLNEGIEVRLIYDAFGSYHAKKTHLNKLKLKGAKVYPVMPLKYGSFLFTMNYRNHRKAIIIDGTTGFAGGMNISDRYIKAKDSLGIWKDMHLQLNGPIVNSLHRVFIKDYYFASGEKLLVSKSHLPKQINTGNVNVQLVAGGPDSKHLSILQQYLMLINVAQKSIYITNPYFIPNQALLEATKMAALSGVDVRVLVPKKTDSSIATHSMFANFEELLAAGVKIYLEDTFSHSKVIIVDNEVASVGSGNFDHRSFEHNFETNILIYDKETSNKLTKLFLENSKKCTKLNLKEFKNRSLFNKLKEGSARFFSPLL